MTVVPAPPFGAGRGSYARRVTLRLVVAEDNFIAREGLRSILTAAPELSVVAVCADV